MLGEISVEEWCAKTFFVGLYATLITHVPETEQIESLKLMTSLIQLLSDHSW